ncbi:Polyphosphate:AMP phosphotransferase [Methanimicrococcus sp. At1]|uniref:Polyphosphate:AMP phosphotransferase n=1 Tax=Methanimicrococcus hacksteinii TaxID=3028293 RepID=A0ABU3VR31_9EURY|nr:phosphate--AMP phosphotransferase [Methanimicrococcus sp. At1]MDV0445873.1 Polyphosphate:AMP phosphotransferase [Methanimicrococcus sp. At1]
MVSEYKPDFPEDADFEKLIDKYGEELGVLQREAHELDIPIIIVFEGWYDVFIGEVINRQLLPLDSRGFDFHFTDAPTSEENKIPFIFRFSQKIPPKGKIAVFDRSWYMRGLIEHLLNDSDIFGCSNLSKKSNIEAIFTEPANKEIINSPKFERMIKTFNDFEKTLSDNGTYIIKIYLGARKETREESHKIWKKIMPYNIDKRSTEKIYKKDIHVIKEVIEKTNTEYAPWNLYFVDKNIDEVTAGTMQIITQQIKKAIFDVKSKRALEENSVCALPKQNLIKTEGPLDLVDLSKSYTKKEYKEKLKKYQKKLAFLHYSLYLNKKPMVLVFEGWDAAGKGSSIKRIVQAMNPRYYRVIPTGSPTDVDQKYHYLWRFLDGIPPCGKTSIYDRSWYGRVMVERIENFCAEDEWKRAYDEINHFEKVMTNDGVIVIKFWMHISKEKQYERFVARSLNPLKQWKLTDEDWRNREKWDDYYAAVNEMIEKTSMKDAPWVIVEANDKYYARIKVLKTIVERIEEELGSKMEEMDFPVIGD